MSEAHWYMFLSRPYCFCCIETGAIRILVVAGASLVGARAKSKARSETGISLVTSSGTTGRSILGSKVILGGSLERHTGADSKLIDVDVIPRYHGLGKIRGSRCTQRIEVRCLSRHMQQRNPQHYPCKCCIPRTWWRK